MNNIKNALAKTSNYMKGSIGIVILALILACLSAILTIIGPNKIGDITNLIADGFATGIDINGITKTAIVLIVIYCLGALFTFIQQYIMAKVTLKMSYRMRNDISEKINNIPQEYFNTHYQGDILSRVTNDVSTLQQGLTNSLPTIISAVTQFIGCLIMMFITEWRLALVALGITLIGLLIIVIVMKNSQKYFIARQKSLGDLNGYVEEMYTGHDVIKISLAKDNVNMYFDNLNKNVYDANWKSQFLSGMMQPLMSIIGNVSYVAVCVLGSILLLNGTITEFGIITAFILYVRLFTSPLTQIAQGLTNMQTSSAAAKRIFEFLEEKEMPDESDKLHLDNNIIGKIDFENVQFAYPDMKDKIIIHDFHVMLNQDKKLLL